MSALFVTVENFIPTFNGGTVATLNYFKALYSPGIVLIAYYDRNNVSEEKALAELSKEFSLKDVKLIPFEIRIRRNIIRLIRTAIIMIFKGYPYLAAKFFSNSIVRSLVDYLKKGKPDVIYLDHMNLAFLSRYVKKVNSDTKVVVINHNNEYELVSDCAKREKGVLRIVLLMESHLIDRYQVGCLRYVDDVRCISFTDAENLNKRYGTNKFSHSPMPYFFERKYNFNSDKKNSVGMCGSLAWPLTIEGLDWYLANIHPYLCQNVVGYEFLLAGSGASKALAERLSNLRNTHYYGYVENLEEFYSKCKLIIVPSLSGSGIRVKILEAFSMSVPVVATERAVHGLRVTNGAELFYEDDPAKFTEYVINLLRDRALREKLSRKAYEYLVEVHGTGGKNSRGRL